MAIGIAGTNPELTIEVKYNTRGSEASLKQLTTRVESIANQHEKRLTDAINKSQNTRANTNKTYYSNLENAHSNYTKSMQKLDGNFYGSALSSQNKYQSKSLNGYSNFYNHINSMSGNRVRLMEREQKFYTSIAPLQSQYLAGMGVLSNELNKTIGTGTVGAALLGGTAGVGIKAFEQTPKIIRGNFDTYIEGFRDFKVRLAAEYRTLQGDIKRMGAPLDEDSAKHLGFLKDQQFQIKQSIQNITAYQKGYRQLVQGSTQELEKQNQQIEKTSVLSGMVQKFAVLAGVAYGAWKITSFVIDLGVAAAQTEQLQKAFDKLSGDATLFQKLQDATSNAVPTRQLLSIANYGAYMGIDIQQLPTLLKFANVRAMETGQSIDYMVQSIVTGLGRKSPLILDNLGLKLKDLDAEVLKIAKSSGISVTKVGELEREFFLTEAAVNVARKAIKESGVDMNNFAINTQKITAQWEELKISLGQTLKSDAVTDGLVFLMTGLQVVADWIDVILGKDTALHERILTFVFGSVGMQLAAQKKEHERQLKQEEEFFKRRDELIKRYGHPYETEEDLNNYNKKQLDKKIKKYAEAFKKQMAEISAASAKGESWEEKLAKQIDAQKKLRDETTKHIAVLNDYKNKYKDNADVLAIINKLLDEQRNILTDLNRQKLIQDYSKTGVVGPVSGIGANTMPDDFLKGNIFKQFDSSKLPEVFGVAKNKYMELMDELNDRTSTRVAIQQWKELKKSFVGNNEAIDLIDKKIKNLKDSVGDSGGFEKAIDAWNQFFSEWGGVISGAMELYNTAFVEGPLNALYNQMDVLQEVINLENQRWDNANSRMEESGIKNTAYYFAQKKAHEKYVKELEAKEYKLKGDVWDADKQAKMTGAIMNTAQGIMGAWAAGPVIGAIMSAIIAATGALQLSQISSQKNPYRKAMGGWIDGTGYTDSVDTLLTPGEFVINRNAARENAALLEQVNNGSYREGGITNVYVNIDGTIVGQDDWVEQKLLPSINNALSKGFSLRNN